MTTDIEKASNKTVTTEEEEVTSNHHHHHEEGCCDHDHDHDHDDEHDSESDDDGLEGDEKILNRNEKKARKLLSKMGGLKPVPGIERVTIKRSRVIFAIANPTVFKTSADTYIVFGEAKVEDAGLQAQAMAAQRLAAAAQRPSGGQEDDTGKEKATNEGGQSVGQNDDEEVDMTGVDEKDIRIVMEQTGVSRSKAVAAFKANNSDIVNTIMELTM